MRYPHLCLQIQMSNASRPMSEDCLYLNIYRPRPYRDNRAVMVRFPFVLFADSHQQLVLCTIATFFTNDTASAKLYPLSLDQKKGQTVFVVRLRKLSSGMRIVNPMKCYWSAHVS